MEESPSETLCVVNSKEIALVLGSGATCCGLFFYEMCSVTHPACVSIYEVSAIPFAPNGLVEAGIDAQICKDGRLHNSAQAAHPGSFKLLVLSSLSLSCPLPLSSAALKRQTMSRPSLKTLLLIWCQNLVGLFG